MVMVVAAPMAVVMRLWDGMGCLRMGCRHMRLSLRLRAGRRHMGWWSGMRFCLALLA